MKTVLLFLGLVVASPIHFLFLEEAFDSDDSSADDFMKMMLLSPGLLGKSETQARQMNPMLPYMLMDKGNDENSKMIMMLMLQDPNISLDNILPYIMLENEEIDMKSLFLVTTVMQKNCESTNDQLNMLLPLLLFRNEEKNRRKRETEESTLNEKLKMLILMQAMSDGNNGLDINSIMPYLMMNYETEANDEDNLLLMVLMNLISGEMDSKDGFRDNFNLLVPLLLGPEDREFDSDMFFILNNDDYEYYIFVFKVTAGNHCHVLYFLKKRLFRDSVDAPCCPSKFYPIHTICLYFANRIKNPFKLYVFKFRRLND